MRGYSPEAQRKFEGLRAGEEWAYRARHIDPLVRVEIIRTGSREPPRVLIRFHDEAFEGREEWVPPGRLQVAWAEVDAFRATEARWAAVEQASRVTDTEVHAADIVFDKLIESELASLIYNVDGVVRIHEVDALAASLDIDADVLRSDPVSFVEAGDLVAPWPIAKLIVQRACARDPEPILRFVEKEEADAAQEAMYGSWYPGRGGKGTAISPEICREIDEEHGQPVRETLRGWCGTEAVAERDELAALRTEVERIGNLTEAAISALRRAGANAEADRIERELGIPVELLRGSRR
jgi:hypothetical protein